jgi:hypothetical protein
MGSQELGYPTLFSHISMRFHFSLFIKIIGDKGVFIKNEYLLLRLFVPDQNVP